MKVNARRHISFLLTMKNNRAASNDRFYHTPSSTVFTRWVQPVASIFLHGQHAISAAAAAVGGRQVKRTLQTPSTDVSAKNNLAIKNSSSKKIKGEKIDMDGTVPHPRGTGDVKVTTTEVTPGELKGISWHRRRFQTGESERESTAVSLVRYGFSDQ